MKSHPKSAASLVATVFLAVALATCIEQRDPTSPLPPIQYTVATLPDDKIFEDPLMLTIARDMPTFGGFYYNAAGQLEVAVTDAAHSFDATQRVRRLLPPDLADRASFATRTVQYSFIDLARYRTLLRQSVFDIPNVVSIGVRESANRVAVATTDAAARPRVLSLIAAVGVPVESVVFDHVEPITYLADSLHHQQPQGKVQGSWQFAAIGSGTGCTLGFPALRRSDESEVFVVNSHCTYEEYDPDGGWGAQPAVPDTIGYELSDPAGSSCGGDICVDADAALFLATVAIDLGKIARTTTSSSCDYCDAGTEVDATYPTITMTSRWEHTIENETLHKIGLQTGWTYGNVEDTCHDNEVEGTVIECTDRVDFSAKPGDSGSPVFSYNGGVGGSGQLRGVVWVTWYNPIGGDHDGLMSDLYQIEQRLGGLVTYDPGPPSVAIDGPLSVKTGLMCTWTASITGGIDPFVYEWTGLFTGDTEAIDRVATTSGWLYLEITDWKGRTANTSEYITVSPSGPSPPGCTE